LYSLARGDEKEEAMRFYEVAAVIATAATLLAFAGRRSKAKSFLVMKDPVHLWTTVASSLFIAIIAMAGLVFLGSENLTGIH
jgi:hypothetical protein